MKYIVGDKVKHNSGDWMFYGTVTAIIENSISPCYRLSIERMEKNKCQFTITQFEFELESYPETEAVNSAFQADKFNIEYFRALSLSQKKETVYEVKNAETDSIPLHQTVEKKRVGWDVHFNSYVKGEKNNSISAWMYQNRKQHKEGTLKEERFNKLIEVNFLFDSQRKMKKNIQPIPPPLSPPPISLPIKKNETRPKEPKDIWHKQFRQWKNGENRKSLQLWRQTNVKRFVAGKLSDDKIEKLKEIGILK